MSKNKFISSFIALLSDIRFALIALLSDIRFALIALFLTVISIAGATFIEKFYGSNTAFSLIYHNSALYLIFTIIILSFVLYSIKLKLITRKRYGAIFIHSAFAIIIIGAITTHYTGKEGSIHLREGETSSKIMYKDGSFGTLPYSITLNEFSIEYYEGNEFPLAYKSYVTINNSEESYDDIVAVNKILRVNRDRIYQLSYDDDMTGTTLLVNNDFSGTLITYIGYILLLYGFILSMFGKNGKIKDIFKSISSRGNKTTIIIIFLFSCTLLKANDLVINENNLIPLNDAKKWENILVLSNNGIIEPLECHARTILRKITHSNGNSNDLWGARLYMSLITFPEIWNKTPIIYCKDETIIKTLNIKSEKYISFNSLFNDDGSYKLNSIDINKVNQKELKKLDERARIYSALINCSLLKIFPTEDGKWVSPNNNVYKGRDSLFVASSIINYIKDTDSNSNEIIDHIASFQEMKYKGVLPSSSKRDLSIIYSKTPIFKLVAFCYIILGGMLFFFAIKYSNSTTFMQYIKIGAVMGGIFAIFLLQSTGIILRWYISEQPPWSNTYETMIYVAWCMTLGGLLFMKRNYLVFALASIMAGITLFIASLSWLDPVITPLMPVLNSPWLILHVSIITASYGFFGISAIIGLYTLIISFKKNSLKLIKELSNINELIMYIGLILVTIGTFLGAVWANNSWGRYWGWDAKESWALITIFVYAIVTHSRLIPKLKNDIIFSSISILATLSVLMTYFGVNYYLSGLHSYGNSDTPITTEYILIGYSLIVIISIVSYFKHRRNSKLGEY